MKRMRAVAAGLVLLATITVGAGTASATTTCDTRWPVPVSGQPTSLRAGSRVFGYLWHDDAGWHLRVTHNSARRMVFTGHVQADEPLAFREVLDEKHDTVRMDADHKGFTYRFVNWGRFDGANFRTDCAHRLAVSIDARGQKVSTRRIVVGHDNAHPTSNPVVVTR